MVTASAETVTLSAVPITFSVTAPEVPPPVIPAPATTLVMSPTSGVVQAIVPLPSEADSTWLADGTAAGIVSVYEVDTAVGALTPTKSVPVPVSSNLILLKEMSDILTSVPVVLKIRSITSITLAFSVVPQVSVDPPTVGLVIPKLVVGLAIVYPSTLALMRSEDPPCNSRCPCSRRPPSAFSSRADHRGNRSSFFKYGSASTNAPNK